MRTSNLKYGSRKGKLKIPMYDIGTIVAGFYIGYNEGKGIDTSQTVEYLTKYFPTALALCATPLILKAGNMFGRWTNRQSIKHLEIGDLEITRMNGTLTKYKDLSKEEKKYFASKIITNVNNLESKLYNQKYLKPTLRASARTAIETLIGYTAGRIYSQIN